MLRDLSGVDDARAREIVSAWHEWSIEDVVGTISELRRVADADHSLEFDALFRAATSFPAPQVRLECVRALSNGGGINIAHALIVVLERDEVSEIRAAAAAALHAFSDSSQARNISATTLNRIKSALRNTLHVDENIVRGKALKSLAALREEDAPDLIDTMFDEAIGNGALMSDVLSAMGETGDRSWLTAIEDAFYSDDAEIRIAAVLAFGNIANDEDIGSLSEPFDDHILEVQMATIETLERIGTPQAREMLALAVSNSEPEVQVLAEAALNNLKAEDELIHPVSPGMVERGLFGIPASARKPTRDLSRYDAPTEEGWANVASEGQELDIAETPEDIGEDYEDYLESDEFFRDTNTN
jgi:HEAT repeat protein